MTTVTAAPIIPPSCAWLSPLEELSEAATLGTGDAETVIFATVEEATVEEAAGCASVSAEYAVWMTVVIV
jgi:hypothetical protein